MTVPAGVYQASDGIVLLVTRCAKHVLEAGPGSVQEACALELKSWGGLPWGTALCPFPCEACTQGLPRPQSHHVARCKAWSPVSHDVQKGPMGIGTSGMAPFASEACHLPLRHPAPLGKHRVSDRLPPPQRHTHATVAVRRSSGGPRHGAHCP